MDELIQQIGDCGISNDDEVILYACGMFPYAARAWWVLHYAGHENVRVLNGGIAAWKNVGGQVEQEIRKYEPTIFLGNPTISFSGYEWILA
jgi:thiosulfate/3-mercaptopyruvate sulfurtransferase